MDVKYPDTGAQPGDEHALLAMATRLLEEAAGSAPNLKIEWDRSNDENGRPVYTLRLSDRSGSASGGFSPEDLRDTTHLRYRLIRLWGDLLQARSHKQLQELLGAGSSGS
jgi:hypothetical protein